MEPTWSRLELRAHDQRTNIGEKLLEKYGTVFCDDEFSDESGVSPIDACCATCSTREEDDPDEVDDLVFEDCVDSADWYMDEKPSKDCTWIGKKIENRCDDEYIGVDGKSSKESCPVTCELCEEDESNDATWDDKETWDDKNYEEEEEWKTWDDTYDLCDMGKEEGEKFCEETGFEKADCEDQSCCSWDDDACWYNGEDTWDDKNYEDDQSTTWDDPSTTWDDKDFSCCVGGDGECEEVYLSGELQSEEECLEYHDGGMCSWTCGDGTWDDKSTTWDDQSTTWDDKSGDGTWDDECTDSTSWWYKKTKYDCEKMLEKYGMEFCTDEYADDSGVSPIDACCATCSMVYIDDRGTWDDKNYEEDDEWKDDQSTTWDDQSEKWDD